MTFAVCRGNWPQMEHGWNTDRNANEEEPQRHKGTKANKKEEKTCRGFASLSSSCLCAFVVDFPFSIIRVPSVASMMQLNGYGV